MLGRVCGACLTAHCEWVSLHDKRASVKLFQTETLMRVIQGTQQRLTVARGSRRARRGAGHWKGTPGCLPLPTPVTTGPPGAAHPSSGHASRELAEVKKPPGFLEKADQKCGIQRGRFSAQHATGRNPSTQAVHREALTSPGMKGRDLAAGRFGKVEIDTIKSLITFQWTTLMSPPLGNQATKIPNLLLGPLNGDTDLHPASSGHRGLPS